MVGEGGSLRNGSSLRGRRIDGSEVDPMASVANVADAMLVLAVAFLLALMAYWGVALPGAEKIERDMSELSDDVSAGDVVDGSGYERAGTVYRDPQTGELYMVED